MLFAGCGGCSRCHTWSRCVCGAEGRAGQGRAGQGRAGQGRAGQGRAGQGRAGQGRAGQGRAGQGRAGQGQALPVHFSLKQRYPPENTADFSFYLFWHEGVLCGKG
jgi:hypothetical protein